MRSSETTRPPRVLVTAGPGGAEKLAAALTQRGCEAVHLPCIRIEPPADPHPLVEMLSRSERFDWVVVTSPNGADALVRHATPGSTLPKVAVVGPSTAARVREAGHDVALIPPKARADSLLEALVEREIAGTAVLLLLGDLADDRLERGLSAAGAAVRRVEAYRTVEGVADPGSVQRLLSGRSAVDVVTLMSGSAARALFDAVGDELFSTRLACIGPTTAREVERLGGTAAAVASPHTVPGLVDAVVKLLD